ncbi:MAG: hypothetical protein RLY85_1364, partial [Bacteroidota bacterium]
MRLLILLSAFLISSAGFAQSGFKLTVSVADANGKTVVNPEVELLNFVAAPQYNTNG